MTRTNLLTAILFCLGFQLMAQEPTYKQAEFDRVNGFYEKAYNGYKEASSGYQANENFHGYALCNLKMAQCRLAVGKADMAVQLAERTLNYIQEGLPDETQLEARALGVLGEGYLNLGRNDLALESLAEEEAYYKGQMSLEAAKCYNNLGVVYWNTGNKTTALSYHDRSLNIKKEMLEENDPAIADSYNNIGLIYLDGEYLKAIIYFNQALKIYEEVYGQQHPKVANCYNNLALANSYQLNYNEALIYLNRVLEIWEAIYPGDHPNKAFTLSSKGKILEEKGDLNEALHIQQLALHQYLRIYGDKHPAIANCHNLIGDVYFEKDKFGSAADHYQDAIYSNLYSQSYESLYDIPAIKEYYNADILLSSLQNKAQALEALHFEKTLKPKDLIGSLDTYQKCDELISVLRQLRLNEADKLRLGEISAEVYENGIRIAVDLSRRTMFNRGEYRQRAFEFCERSKSAILLEAINETKAKSFSGIPADLLLLEDSLKTQISTIKQKLAQKSEEEESLKADLFKYEQAYRNFVDELENEYPSYFNLKYNQQFATVPELQNSLAARSAILSYFTGENKIYVFYIDRKSYEIFDFDKDENFSQTASAFRNSIKYNVAKTFKTTSSQLYNQLIPKIGENIDRLVVLPDGILGTLPFEAFIKENVGDGYNTFNYLIQDYAISYDYAATLLLDRLTREKTSVGSGILLTAPVSFSENEMRMPDLPGSESEVKEIKYLFLSSNEKPEVALKSAANESLLKSDQLQTYKYLHFATHGMVNESKPELSRVFLCPSDNEDGSLYSGEIYNLKINADLVTLSACETGLGKIAKGEGIVGLSRSLMYAGAKNLIVSLWQVADASTAELMIDFYKEHLLHSGNDIFSDDLRKAKLNLLKSENYSSPYYWAPFILVGE